MHRLIQNRTDGKFVELPSGHSSKSEEKGSDRDEKGGPDKSDEASQDKIEAMGVQYGVIMTSALENQRTYFQEEMTRANDENYVWKKKWAEVEEKLRKEKSERGTLEKKLEEVVDRIEKEKAGDEARREQAFKKGVEEEINRKKERVEGTKAKKELEKELAAEKAVTASLTENLRHLTVEMGLREGEIQDVRKEIEDMSEQMRDVMFALSARDQIEAQGGEGEMAGGSVSVPTPPPTSSARRKKKK